MELPAIDVLKLLEGEFVKWLIREGASVVTHVVFPNNLDARLARVTTAWLKELPDDARLHDFRTILASHYPKIADNPPPEPLEVSVKLRASLQPTEDDWFTVLSRQWEWVRTAHPSPTEFFQIDPERAKSYLRDLAERLAKECQKEPELARGQSLANDALTHGKLDFIIAHLQAEPKVDPTGFHPKIDAACKFTQSGKPDVAIAQLEAMRQSDWDKMDGRARFRVLANLGHAHNAKDEPETAARYFIESRNYQQDDEKARSWEVVGHYMLGKTELAWTLANSVLDDFPTSDLACAVRIRCEPKDKKFIDIESRTPEVLKSFPETQIALSVRAAHESNFDAAEQYARLANQSDTFSPVAAEHLAMVLLNRVRAEHPSGSLSVPNALANNERLKEAQQLLVAAIEKMPLVAPIARGRIRFYQAVASNMAGNLADADTHIRLALDSDAANPEYIRHFAIIQCSLEHDDNAIRVLKTGLEHDVTGSLGFMYASCLLDRHTGNDSTEAKAYLDNRLTNGPTIDAPIRADYVTCLLKAYARDNEHSAAAELVEREQATLPAAIYSTIKATVLRRAGRLDESEASIRTALALAKESSDITLKANVADELTAQRLWREALVLWKEVVSPTNIGPDSQAALRCAWFAKDDAYLLECCAALRRNGCFDAATFHMEVNKLIEYNATDTAIAAMSAYLESPSDDLLAREVRARLTQLALMLGRDDLVCFDLALLPRPEDAEPDIGLLVVMNLAHGPRPIQAVEYAYEFVRQNFTSSRAHKAMILSVFWRPKDLHVPEPEIIASGTAVKYRDEESGVEHWHIIEDSPNRDSGRLEFGPDNVISKAMMGKRVGDRFFIRQDDVQSKRAIIVEVWSKYKFRFRRSLDDWETRFPDDKWLWSFSFKPGRDDNFAPAFRAIDKQAAFIKEREEIYANNSLAASAFAQMAGVTVLQAVRHIIGSGTLPLRCCLGQRPDIIRAEAAFETSKTVILDESALATLHLTGLFKELDSLTCATVVSRGTYLELRKVLMEMKNAGTHRMTKAETDNKYVLIEDTEEVVKQRHAEFDEFIRVIETNCKIVDGTALAWLPESTREDLERYIGRPAAETIALAQKNGYILWSDDIWVTYHGAEKCGVTRVWTEWLLTASKQKWQISSKKINKCIALLIACRYLFTRLTAGAMLPTLIAGKWSVDEPQSKALLDWFAIAELTDALVAEVAGDVLLSVFQQAPTTAARDAIISAILRRLCWRKNAKNVLALVGRRLNQLFAEDSIAARELKKTIVQWARAL